LFYVCADTTPENVKKLKHLQYKFTSHLPDIIVYTVTDYLKGEYSTASEIRAFNDYLDYIVNTKNNKPQPILLETVKQYNKFIEDSKHLKVSFFGFLELYGFSDGTKIRTYEEFLQ